MSSAPAARRRVSLTLLYLGAALTLVAAALPLVPHFRALLRDHVSAGYPGYTQPDVDTAVTTYVGILVVVGGLGLLGWGAALWAAHAGARATRWLMAGLLVAGALLAIAALTIRDTSGDVGLAPLFGWLLVAPCVAGAAAFVLWTRPA
ncbi:MULTISPECIES: hypothetical protein [Microbacterium]|uniref:hypothetical protein n=1 Tax=Microbacterium TaxID=33882 RepID=UPI000D64C4B9|nr:MULTISPECIES: hypothetical protein [Microbacterium]